MQAITLDRRLSQIFLSLVPFLIFGSALVRGLRRPIVYPLIVGGMFAAIVVAAWRLGASSIAGNDDRKGFTLAGILLIAPWAVLSVLVGLGPPWQATATENLIRFTALLIAGVLMTGGFVVVTGALREAGEGLYSALGFAAIILAGPLFVMSVLIPMTVSDIADKQRASAGQLQEWLLALKGLAEAGLVVEVILTYVATAAFALALNRASWLGRAGRVYAGISLFAILCLATTIVVSLQHPGDPTAVLKIKIAIPGFIVSIPAIPFIMPHLIGVKLLRRAGDKTEVTR